MRWEDEGYVKLYSRDTPTWKAMCWQARALLPLLLRKVDKAGLLECGDLGKAAVGLMVDLPEEVVIPGLASLERLRVIVWHDNVLEIPNYEEAQEARKSDVLRKRESRQKAKDEVRAQAVKNTQSRSHGVTRSHTASEMSQIGHAPDIPSPAQPSSAQKRSAGSQANAADGGEAESAEYKQLVADLFAAFEQTTGTKPSPRPKDFAALKRLRAKHSAPEILTRAKRGLVGKYKRDAPTWFDLEDKWDALATDGADPPLKATGTDVTRGYVRAEGQKHTGGFDF